MVNIFLSYAHADGSGAAVLLRQELTQMGFTVWRDNEALRGGRAWKDQLRAAQRGVDVLLALLTPGYVASSTCTWEWETALTLDKRVIPLLIEPCDIPEELARLQYHNLSNPAIYTLGLAKLVRDLIELGATKSSPASPPAAAAGGSKYTVVQANQSAIGDNATVVNTGSARSKADPELIERVLRALAQRQSGAGANQGEFEATLREISSRLGGIEHGVSAVHDDVKAVRVGLAQVLGHFERQYQEIVAPILAHMDEHHLAQIDATLAAVETNAVAADEIDRLLASITKTLAAILATQHTLLDPATQQRLHQVVEVAGNEMLNRRHRLKLTVPIIPALLAYEAEIDVEAQSRLAELWQALTRLFH